MAKPMQHDKQPRRRAPRKKFFLPVWFKVCAAVLFVLVLVKSLQLQVFLEIQFDGIPHLTALTEIETWFIPLGLLLLYILWNWLWSRLFGSREF